MDDYKLEKYKKLLLDEKERISKVLENIQEHQSDDELSTVDNHPADIGTELFMREQDEGFKVSYKSTLEEIENSLSNIDDGSYGLCDSCGKEISQERLEVIPYASMCTECMYDESDIDNEYESLDRDFITKRSQSKNNVHFDREDSYQEVAEYEKISKDPSHSTGDYMGVHDEDEGKNTDELDNISQEYYDETQE